MIGVVVWIKANGDQPNAQRARIEAYAVGHIMVTMRGTKDVKLFPVAFIRWLEFDDECKISFVAESASGLPLQRPQ